MYYDDDVRFSGPVEKTDTRRVFVLNVELKRHDLSLIKKKIVLKSMIHHGRSYAKMKSGCT